MTTKLLDVPLYMQGLDTCWCVPYSMVGIAEFFGIDAPFEDMIEACGASKRYGADTDVYTKGIEKFGLQFKRLNFTFDEIYWALRKGFPVAVCYMINPNESHFTTIIQARRDYRGMGHYLLNDTYHGRFEMPEPLLIYLKKLEGTSWARIVQPKK